MIIHKLPDELLIEALQAYSKVKRRSAGTFKPGTAANTELNSQAALLDLISLEIKSGNITPLEQAIEAKKK